MGQYFRIVNYDKREYVKAQDIGEMKLWEWCANHEAAVFPFLLARSDDGERSWRDEYPTAGRWAGDRVALVGDYDRSGDYQRAEREFRNITEQLRADFNAYIGHERLKI